ncbi:MAG: DUF1934 domain-containing protein [Hyphomonadaceae bacterium]|nr:DUF1934 domain-containing protein [Clostridia bacterium]
MDKKDVIISVIGQHHMDDDTDQTELMTQGDFYKKGAHYYAVYKETMMTGMQGTTTTLKIGTHKLSLMRFGTTNTQMIFEKGQRHSCHYDTAHGMFTMDIFAHQVDIAVDENGGEIKVSYDMALDNIAMGRNDFVVKITRVNESTQWALPTPAPF